VSDDRSPLICPFDLSVEPIARFLNAELADDPHYDGIELQWFDDPIHGSGMLVFLSRRETRIVDYYVAPGLRLDRGMYVLGAGVGVWQETVFEVGRLEVHPDGVTAEVHFVDVDGRPIEVHIDDRDGASRRRGTLLAPVGAGIDHPASLLLVWLHGFDLVAESPTDPVIRIDGRQASTGTLPGQRLHRRELIKYAAPLTTVMLNRTADGPVRLVDPDEPGGVHLDEDGAIGDVIVEVPTGQRARLALRPGFVDLRALADGAAAQGRWRIGIDDTPAVTGGTWRVERNGDEVDVAMSVTQRWRPGPQPPIMKLVTTVVPTFSRWPTTYRYQATVTLGDEPTISGGWQRTGTERGDAYRRATGG